MYAAIPSLATTSPHPSFAHCIVDFPYAFKCCLYSWNVPVIDNHYFHTWHQTFLWCLWVQCWREEYLFRWEPCKVDIWGQFQCLWVSLGRVNSLNVQMLEYDSNSRSSTIHNSAMAMKSPRVLRGQLASQNAFAMLQLFSLRICSTLWYLVWIVARLWVLARVASFCWGCCWGSSESLKLGLEVSNSPFGIHQLSLQSLDGLWLCLH